MKKFYSMIAMAMLAGGSMVAAAPAINPQALVASGSVQMSEEGAALFRAEQAYNNYVVENGIDIPGSSRFTWTDGSGNTWNGSFYVSGTWADNFTTWDGNKYYCKVTVNVFSNKANSQIIYHIFYPTKAMWQNPDALGFATDAPDSQPTPLNIFQSKLASQYGFIVPKLSENGANSFYIGMANDNDFVIVNSNTPNSSGSPYFSANSSMGLCIYNGTRCGAAEGSRFSFSQFDPSTNSINMRLNGNATNASGSTVWTYDLSYAGEAIVVGFPDCAAMETELGELHIVNTGVQNYDNNEFYDVQWPADLNGFYYVGCTKDMTLSVDAQPSSSSVTWWSKTTYPEQALYTSQEAASAGVGQYIHGTLFSPTSEADPYGEWNLYDIKTTGSNPNWQTTNAPIAWSWLDGNWIYPWSENNGTYGRYCGVFISWNPEETAAYKPFVMNGTTKGWGLKGECRLGSTSQWHFDGNIIYHYDASDYTKTRTIASVGTRVPNANWNAVNSIFADGNENNFTVNANNGYINVTVENAANVAVYNLAGAVIANVNAAAGQIVTVPAVNGVYVVKVGEKAVKVIL